MPVAVEGSGGTHPPQCPDAHTDIILTTYRVLSLGEVGFRVLSLAQSGSSFAFAAGMDPSQRRRKWVLGHYRQSASW